MEALIEGTRELRFAVDLGWLHAAGRDPVEFLRSNIERIRYVHLRDMREGSDEALDLGAGAVDIAALVRLLDDHLGEDGWTVVEYETGRQEFARYTAARRKLKEFGV
jgi:sugar phosphate isomerase/epimerase